jgi:hypothetical protein
MACETGNISQVHSIKEYRYPTEFEPDKSGLAVPTAFETRNEGCDTSLKISLMAKQGSYSVDAAVTATVLENTVHYAASKTDTKGSITQPIFTDVRIRSQVQMTIGTTKLLGMETPYKEKEESDLLWVAFLSLEQGN